MIDLCLYLALIDDENEQIKFRNVCEEYKESMFDIAMGFTKDYFDAQDAISLALYSIARNIQNIDANNKERTKGYIYKIIKNASYDVLRKRQKINKIYNIEDFEDIIPTECLSDEVIDNEQYKSIILLIQTIPDLYRDVISLYYVYEYSIVTISKSLRRPPSTIRKQLQKGTELLKQILKEKHFHE